MKRPWLWGGLGLAAVIALALLFASPGTTPNPNGNQVGYNQLNEQTPPGSPVRDLQNMDQTPLDSTPERMSMRVADAAKSVEGVDKAYGVALGTTALVGLDLSEMIKGSAIRSTEEEVAKQVEELREIRQALVTSDPNLVTRIRKVAEGVADGKPLTSFANETADLTRRLTPTGKM